MVLALCISSESESRSSPWKPLLIIVVSSSVTCGLLFIVIVILVAVRRFVEDDLTAVPNSRIVQEFVRLWV